MPGKQGAGRVGGDRGSAVQRAGSLGAERRWGCPRGQTDLMVGRADREVRRAGLEGSSRQSPWPLSFPQYVLGPPWSQRLNVCSSSPSALEGEEGLEDDRALERPETQIPGGGFCLWDRAAPLRPPPPATHRSAARLA